MKGPAGLSGRIRGLVAVLIVAGCASVLPEADQGVLDFSPPPVNLHPGRLVRLNGQILSWSDARPSFSVDPGEHEITVATFIGGPRNVGRNQPATTQADPGLVTIDVKPGKRYRIASRLTEEPGEW
jgi:hypothetical protein